MSDDLTAMNDPEFFTECERVRDELEHSPTVELSVRYQQLSDEFIRRATQAWKGGRS